jgi:hypothetical protein
VSRVDHALAQLHAVVALQRHAASEFWLAVHVQPAAHAQLPWQEQISAQVQAVSFVWFVIVRSS